MNCLRQLLIAGTILVLSASIQAQFPPFPLAQSALAIDRPTQPAQPFTVAGERGVLVGTQDGSFESWILPVKLLSHLTIEANLEGYTVPIPVNPQSANIEVQPGHTTITYSHPGFTIRQIMFSPDIDSRVPEVSTPSTGPIVLFQIDAVRPLDLTFRFTPEMRWMWPKRNEGIPSPEWIPAKPQPTGEAEPPQPNGEGFYMLHLDYGDLAGAVTIPGATPGILAPYQERPQVHPLELRLHYNPQRDGAGPQAKFFPLLMAVATTPQSATAAALRQSLQQLNDGIPAAYKAHAARYAQLESESTAIETPDKSLNQAFRWAVVSIEQLTAREFSSHQTALVAGYYASGDSARPGFGWFFGRDALYTLYAVNGFGDFALTRAELEFLIARQRPDGKIMHEYSQTASDPGVDWKSFPYMYAAADATPLFLMAMRDYLRASNDLAFVQSHQEAIEKAWAFETAPTSDTDHDGIYDNSQGTGWVESWPDRMPHQEVYLALLDEQASSAYAALETALDNPAKASAASSRATQLHAKIEAEYYDPAKGCYAFSHNLDGAQDKSSTVYPAIAYWDYGSSLAQPAACLSQWANTTLATDWGLRDVATTESFYDGLSYHQGSVWPLFTGWGALAEYRANQPLAGEQMLMQNVDLTWAQDPGAVTELLSGDFFVPFGRSTSHQLWSSAMVVTPTLRGLFGISLDAAANTVTVNPHLPAEWKSATIKNLHFANLTFDLQFRRDQGQLHVTAISPAWLPPASPRQPILKAGSVRPEAVPQIRLVSGLPGARSPAESSNNAATSLPALTIPLPIVQIGLGAHSLPAPGSRTTHLKILSADYTPSSLTVVAEGQSGTDSHLTLRRAIFLPNLKLISRKVDSGAIATLGAIENQQAGSEEPISPMDLHLHFPEGQGWQTLEFTLTW